MRRTLILGILFSIVAGIVAVTLIATLYETPSCGDGIQNQDESGVDCGGSCTTVCTRSTIPPVVAFARAVPGPSGRTDVVAYVENKNAGVAAQNIEYEVELYDANNMVIASKKGTLDLPPSSSVPLYLPGVYSGETPAVRTFLSVYEDEESWYRFEEDTRTIPEVGEIVVGGSEEAPRVTALLKNPSPEILREIQVVATVFDEEDNAIAASQTVIAEMRAGGSVMATFTWANAFKRSPARIDVRPVISLPELTERI